MSSETQEVSTPLEALVNAVRSSCDDYNDGVEEAPCVILWPDPDKSWSSLLDDLRASLPELLTLGDFELEERSGPAIWLRCAMERKLANVELPTDRLPILYLPGVARHELRNADQCGVEIQPLVELLYRGTVWSHRNGRDWTVEGFFVSPDGLELDMAQDEATRQSLRSGLSSVAKTPLTALRGRRLAAVDFDAIVVGDTPRDVLTWIGAGDVIPADWSQERWHAFRSRCRDEFDFDPDEEKPLYMAERLGKREGKWSQLWDRFCEAPGAYHGVREMLEQAQPMDQMTFEGEPWPRINREREANLSVGLGKLEGLSPADARSQLAELEMAHKERREWVWAKTGEAPLALALKPLMRLADGTRVVPSFQTVAEYASWYDEIGAGVDAAALSSYRGIKEPPHRNAICGVIRALYLPWLEEVCRKFQEVVLKQGFEKPGPVEAQAGDCLLFVDGLRLDLGKDLIKVLERSGNEVSMSLRHSALPPITPTAKPVVSPVAPLLEGKFLPPDFQTQYDGKILTHDVFKKLLGQVGYPWIDLENITGPENEDSCGWCEAGKIDHYGHKLGEELPMQLPQQIGVVADAVSRLFDAGWRRVLVVTDHGWLLMPGNLPKYDLPGCVVEQRWSRTAVAKGESNPDVPKIPWHWNEAFHVLVPHGANAFKNTAYSHGGISPQECFIPVITVSPPSGQGGGARARISSVKWRGLRCVIQVEDGAGMTADVHDLKMSTSLVAGGAKTVEEDGEVSLLITDGDYVGSEVLVFVQDSAGTVQAKQNSTVGG